MQGLIRSGAIRCGMVVSGEQNMPLAWTATREVRHSLDRQLAALTLGDCGAAVIVDGSPDETHGFHWLDLVTGARHDHYCYSQPSARGGGGILITKARGLQIVGNRNFPAYLKQALDATGWDLNDVHHVIPHQVSVRAIRQGIKAVKRFMGCDLPDVSSATSRSTPTPRRPAISWRSTTSCWQGKIQPGQNVVLVSGASGIVISHATFTLDDLPQRYRAHVNGAA